MRDFVQATLVTQITLLFLLITIRVEMISGLLFVFFFLVSLITFAIQVNEIILIFKSRDINLLWGEQMLLVLFLNCFYLLYRWTVGYQEREQLKRELGL